MANFNHTVAHQAFKRLCKNKTYIPREMLDEMVVRMQEMKVMQQELHKDDLRDSIFVMDLEREIVKAICFEFDITTLDERAEVAVVLVNEVEGKQSHFDPSRS